MIDSAVQRMRCLREVRAKAHLSESDMEENLSVVLQWDIRSFLDYKVSVGKNDKTTMCQTSQVEQRECGGDWTFLRLIQ